MMNIRVLHKAFAALSCLADGPAPLGALAERTGVAKTTLCNILRTLESIGAVRRADGRYELGPKLPEIVGRGNREHALREAGIEPIGAAARRTGETMSLGVLRAEERQLLLVARGSQPLTTQPPETPREDLYRLATGRVLIAHLSPAQRRGLVQRIGLPGEQWADIDRIEVLETACARIRRQPVIVIRDYSPHVAFLAAPVFDPDGQIIAAVGCGVPVARWRGEHRQQVNEEVHAAAEQITKAYAVAQSRPEEVVP
jgi:DNA-binding IclR family transcriptional regulator